MSRIDFIEHLGRRILVLDFSGLVPEELGAVVKEAQSVIRNEPPKSLLTVTKVDGARFNAETVSLLKNFARDNEPYVDSGAIVGLEGLQKIALEAVTRFSKRKFYVCGSLEEAKERLVGG